MTEEKKERKPRNKSTGLKRELLAFDQCIRAVKELPSKQAAERLVSHVAAWIADPLNANEFAKGQMVVPGAAAPDQPTTAQALTDFNL